jgi:vacuolar iron transporter family protein
MRIPMLTGLSFGLTSGIITTLGLIVGLNAGTHSKLAVLGGILTIAIADSFSDALGIHVSQESQVKNSSKSVWISTFSTFVAKVFFALSFAVPVIIFELSTAIIISLVWGFSILFVFSFFLARKHNANPWMSAFEHVLVGILVVIVTHFAGQLINAYFS